jgi:hypothetical protein
MKTLDLEGWVSVAYFPPNDWEYLKRKTTYLYFLYSSKGRWKVSYLDKIDLNEVKTFSTKDFSEVYHENSLGLIYPSFDVLPREMDYLPSTKTWLSHFPPWRASSGFRNTTAQVSYQSDLVPLPEKGSLLTFHPFIQFNDIENYLVVLNAQSIPSKLKHSLLIFNSKSKKIVGTTPIQSNSVTTIELDQFNFSETDLPVFVSTTMAAVPFGLGINSTRNLMSLEHTHPPGSFVVRGDRGKVQKHIKTKWFDALNVESYGT